MLHYSCGPFRKLELADGYAVSLSAVEETMRQRAFANLGERVQLQATSLGRQAGIKGSAALALTTFFYQNSGLPTPHQLFGVTL